MSKKLEIKHSGSVNVQPLVSCRCDNTMEILMEQISMAMELPPELINNSKPPTTYQRLLMERRVYRDSQLTRKGK